MAGLSGIVKKISDLVTGTPADDDCFVFGKSDLKKITLAKLKDVLGITSINSALENNLNANAKSLTNSTYYPSSTIYRSGQVVYLRCSGVTEKEISANLELTIAVEGTIPQEYLPNNNMIFYPIISSGGKIIRVSIGKNGKITYTSPEKLEAGFGINMHLSYMTGKSNF